MLNLLLRFPLRILFRTIAVMVMVSPLSPRLSWFDFGSIHLVFSLRLPSGRFRLQLLQRTYVLHISRVYISLFHFFFLSEVVRGAYSIMVCFVSFFPEVFFHLRVTSNIIGYWGNGLDF